MTYLTQNTELIMNRTLGVRLCVQLRVYSPVVETPSNKLLTTAFEASLESVAVTLQAKRRQQDTRDSY